MVTDKTCSLHCDAETYVATAIGIADGIPLTYRTDNGTVKK